MNFIICSLFGNQASILIFLVIVLFFFFLVPDLCCGIYRSPRLDETQMMEVQSKYDPNLNQWFHLQHQCYEIHPFVSQLNFFFTYEYTPIKLWNFMFILLVDFHSILCLGCMSTLITSNRSFSLHFPSQFWVTKLFHQESSHDSESFQL